MAIHAVFHTLWWAIVGFAVVLAITEATKPFASRYRPDYLGRCQPALSGPNSKAYLTFKQSVDCDPKAKDTDFVKDGRWGAAGELGMHISAVQHHPACGSLHLQHGSSTVAIRQGFVGGNRW